MNRIDSLFHRKKEKVLSVYFTAGYPVLNSVRNIILSLERNGADMIEIGIPYSDPLADGPVIQETGKIAIAGGMTINNLFSQLEGIREESSIPLLLMGYINPVLQYGYERFCRHAAQRGIDGIIIPDLPVFEYEKNYKDTVIANDLRNIFLITPETPETRIRKIDEASTGFLYIVSSASTTGKTKEFGSEQQDYFKRIRSMKLKNPLMAGFGIYNPETLNQAFISCNGAIVGSAFMREFIKGKPIEDTVSDFLMFMKSKPDTKNRNTENI
jgi:tryptophan synthase alpha chain